jgi:L,D-peptidoglycan transpeptidase YkuD (ErfK/YbiS/YcfS/YnhG family)
MQVKRRKPIVVRRAPGRPCEARVQLAHSVRCAAIGRGRLRALKREGDGGTPLGRFPIRRVLYRADRTSRPRTHLPVSAIRDRDGWSDDPRDRNYNRLIKLPSKRSAEGLKRDDNLYDLIIVLGHNDRQRIKGNASAIFMHLARPGYTPTEGCIALSRRDLYAVLAEIQRGTEILVMG